MRIFKPLTLLNSQRQAHQYQQRIVLAAVSVIFLLFILVSRLFYLQVIQHHYFLTLSKQNLLSVAPIDPSRGLIYDRNGILIASNIPVFSLDIVPSQVKNLKQTLKALTLLLRLTPQDMAVFKKQLQLHRKFNALPLKVALTSKEMSVFAVNQYKFAGVYLQAHLIRYYPFGSLMSAVLGYVGRINTAELAKVDSTNYSATNFIGKTGVEKTNESLLHGVVGIQQVETSATGGIVRRRKDRPAAAGQNLYLSIDSRLQASVDAALKDETGGAVILNVRDGEILALVSKPSFGPNAFVTGIKHQAYHQLTSDLQRPLFNRVLQGEFPPGSTIKPFYALGALNTAVIAPEDKIFDPGFFKLAQSKHIYHDWNRRGHGWVNMENAIIQSCDTYFFHLAQKQGLVRMTNTLTQFGFGQMTGIDAYSERKGLVPSQEWKIRAHHHPWFEGDTIACAIGQGYLLVTPLQLAVGLLQIINHGKGFQPHFLIKSVSPTGTVKINPLQSLKPIHFPEKNWQLIISSMQKVVSDPHGTGYHAGIGTPYTFGGKSGTAQIFSLKTNQQDKAGMLPKRLRDHSWFMAFAPAEHPQIILVVFLENGGEGKAAVFARQILDSYFRLHQKQTSAKI